MSSGEARRRLPPLAVSSGREGLCLWEGRSPFRSEKSLTEWLALSVAEIPDERRGWSVSNDTRIFLGG
jgi:hypothetical protein